MKIAICTTDNKTIDEFSKSHLLLIDTDSNEQEKVSYMKAVGEADVLVSTHFDGFAVINIREENGVMPFVFSGTIDEAVNLLKTQNIKRTKPVRDENHVSCGGGCGS